MGDRFCCPVCLTRYNADDRTPLIMKCSHTLCKKCITTLINTQQSLFSAQISLVQTKLTRLQNSINLYIAVGGGWDQKQSDTDYKPQLDWFPL